VPYFAVILAVAESGRNMATQVALILLFNVLFVAPLLLILVVVKLAGDRGARVLTRIHSSIHRHAPVLIPVAALLVGVVLVALGVHGLA
jgi:cytochrome c biogenesis protein CcdA